MIQISLANNVRIPPFAPHYRAISACATGGERLQLISRQLLLN